jgi:hypothetical protein
MNWTDSTSPNSRKSNLSLSHGFENGCLEIFGRVKMSLPFSKFALHDISVDFLLPAKRHHIFDPFFPLGFLAHCAAEFPRAIDPTGLALFVAAHPLFPSYHVLCTAGRSAAAAAAAAVILISNVYVL